MKLTILLFVLLAILAIVATAEEAKKYSSKKCSGKKCGGVTKTSDKHIKVKKQGPNKKEAGAPRQKRSTEEQKQVEEAIATGQKELKKRANENQKASTLTQEKGTAKGNTVKTDKAAKNVKKRALKESENLQSEHKTTENKGQKAVSEAEGAKNTKNSGNKEQKVTDRRETMPKGKSGKENADVDNNGGEEPPAGKTKTKVNEKAEQNIQVQKKATKQKRAAKQPKKVNAEGKNAEPSKRAKRSVESETQVKVKPEPKAAKKENETPQSAVESTGQKVDVSETEEETPEIDIENPEGNSDSENLKEVSNE